MNSGILEVNGLRVLDVWSSIVNEKANTMHKKTKAVLFMANIFMVKRTDQKTIKKILIILFFFIL